MKANNIELNISPMFSLFSYMPDLPLLTNLQQPIHALIISCAGVTPMFCLINITPFCRIPVNMLNLLPHYFFILYPFQIHAFLAELVSSICFMCFFIKSQLFQNCFHLVFVKIKNQIFCCIRFETGDISTQLFTLCNKMQLLFRNGV